MVNEGAVRRAWVREAIRRIEADYQRCSDTHLIPVTWPGFTGSDLYLKDASSHPTRSLNTWLVTQGLECGAQSDAIEVLVQHRRWPDALLQSWRLAGDFGRAPLRLGQGRGEGLAAASTSGHSRIRLALFQRPPVGRAGMNAQQPVAQFG